jgi:glutaredoxin
MSEKSEVIIVYGTTRCPDCVRAKQFLDRRGIAYCWVDVERDRQAMTHIQQLNGGLRIVPTIVFPDGTFLSEPSNAELAGKCTAKN